MSSTYGSKVGAESATTTRVIRSFWLIGLLNNAPWVLMLACATNISSGGVALVFISNMVPGLIVKITAPYWFHAVSYNGRMLFASISMGVACLLVGYGGLLHDEFLNEADVGSGKQNSTGMALELFGVSFISLQCSMGEASSLALAGKFDSSILPKLNSATLYSSLAQKGQPGEKSNSNNCDRQINNFQEEETQQSIVGHVDIEPASDVIEPPKQLNRCITAFSSGTGLAGIVGYGYKSLLTELFGWGLSAVVFSVMSFAVCYYLIFFHGLHKEEQRHELDLLIQADNRGEIIMSQEVISPIHVLETSVLATTLQNGSDLTNGAIEMIDHDDQNAEVSGTLPIQHSSTKLTARERFILVLSLWPYTIPLFTVYAAEYMLQAGVWSAMGFPIESQSARAQFYHYSNWSYQTGVFVSRSSGNLFSPSLSILWLMPLLQVINLIFFWADSIHHFWYNYTLLLPCFYAGLLGGSVYVQGFSRINHDFPIELREFAIASAGVADALGVLLADIASLFIQSCIYDKNGIDGAVVGCPA